MSKGESESAKQPDLGKFATFEELCLWLAKQTFRSAQQQKELFGYLEEFLDELSLKPGEFREIAKKELEQFNENLAGHNAFRSDGFWMVRWYAYLEYWITPSHELILGMLRDGCHYALQEYFKNKPAEPLLKILTNYKVATKPPPLAEIQNVVKDCQAKGISAEELMKVIKDKYPNSGLTVSRPDQVKHRHRYHAQGKPVAMKFKKKKKNIVEQAMQTKTPPPPPAGTPAAATEKNPKSCGFCKQEKQNLKRCSRCQKAYYCAQKCQANDWPTHKLVCFA
jgi:hypothetical protein